jgi:hypothetical protein
MVKRLSDYLNYGVIFIVFHDFNVTHLIEGVGKQVEDL